MSSFSEMMQKCRNRHGAQSKSNSDSQDIDPYDMRNESNHPGEVTTKIQEKRLYYVLLQLILAVVLTTTIKGTKLLLQSADFSS